MLNEVHKFFFDVLTIKMVTFCNNKDEENEFFFDTDKLPPIHRGIT